MANYAPSVGGAQEYFRQVAEGLARRGHDIEVLTTTAFREANRPGSAGPPPAEEVLGGVRVRRFGEPGWARTVASALSKASARLARGDKAHRPLAPVTLGPSSPALDRATWRASQRRDVVVGGPAPYTTLSVPAWAGAGGGAAVVLVPFLHVNLSRPHRAVRRALRRARLVVAATPFEGEVLGDLGVAPEAVAILPPGVDLDRFPATSRSKARARLGLPDRPTVGFVGRLAPYKGVDTFLAAAPLLWEALDEVTVLVAGARSGWDGHREAVAAGLGGDRLVVREDFDAADRAVLLAACDVVVCPSREESFGMVIVEAWAAGRPVVASDLPAVRSTVARCPGSALFPVGDAEALAAAVIELVRDPAAAAAAGEDGRRLVEAEFGWPRIVAAWESHLLELARPRPGRP